MSALGRFERSPSRSAATSWSPGRQSYSLGLRGERALEGLIRLADGTRFGPSITAQPFELARQIDDLVAGYREFEDGARFFRHFRNAIGPDDLAGRSVLDLGCGYGGRTVYYARQCRTAETVGLEPSESVVARCGELARRLESPATRFAVGWAEELPFEDASFDAVVSFDVLEHVTDPVAAFHEIARVLRPDGVAWLVFPTYRGARSSHLDYVTRVPALHRLFDPDAIVTVVNRILERDARRFGVATQPPPQLSALGRRVLPGLNGLTLADARAIIPRAGLQVDLELLNPAVDPAVPVPFARAFARVLTWWFDRRAWPEFLIGSIALQLSKSPGRTPIIRDDVGIINPGVDRTPTELKAATIECWSADPCGSSEVPSEPQGSPDYFRELRGARFGYAPWMRQELEYAQMGGLRVLDVGCGQGIDLHEYALAGAEAVGVDLTPRHADLANAHLASAGLPGEAVVGDAEALPFLDETFDRVASNGVLHHTPDIAAAVSEIFRVLKPGGEVRLILYNRWSFHYWLTQVLWYGIARGMLFTEGSMTKVMSRHVEFSRRDARPLVRVYSARQLRNLLSAAGFASIETRVRHFKSQDTPPTWVFRRQGIRFFDRPGIAAAIGRLAGWYVIGRAVKPPAGS
ncbi:MAG: methyltransferase domain-containing protein [Gaiellaceae bacterium]